MSRCIMLDVDGVVVIGRPADGRPWATDIQRDLGIAPQRLHQLFFVPHWTNIVTGRKGLVETLETCLPQLASGLSVSAFIDYWFEKDSRLDERVLADCDALRRRGLQVFLATNQEHLRAEHLMTRLGLRDHVDGMISSAELGVRKPQPAFFDAALERAGTKPTNTLLIDDTLANIDAARKAGWRAAQWTRGARLLELVESGWD